MIINTEGRNFMIAHLKVGSIQIALGLEIRVIPRPGKKTLAIKVMYVNICIMFSVIVCGDGSCQEDHGESCKQ